MFSYSRPKSAFDTYSIGHLLVGLYPKGGRGDFQVSLAHSDRHVFNSSFLSTVKSVMARRLPPELADRTLDFLHEDILALATCSLVCRAWLPSSSYHLFRELRVRTSTAARYTVSQAINEPDYDLRAFFGFIHTLSESDRIRYSLRNLRLEADSGMGSQCPGINLETLHRILLYLPYLQDLRIDVPRIHPCSEPALLPQLPARRLQKLVFSRVRFSQSVVEILGWFPEIHRLVFKKISDGEAISTAHAVSSSLQIRTFLFDHPGSYLAACEILAMMSKTLDPSTLTTLSITALCSINLPDLGEFLVHKGRHISNLRFSYDETGLGLPHPSFFPISFLHCPSLRTLNIGIHLDLNFGPAYNGILQWTGLMDMLRSTELPSLESLYINCTFHNYGFSLGSHQPSEEEAHIRHGMYRLDWGKFDETMERLVSLSLTRLELQLRGSPPFIRVTSFNTATVHLIAMMETSLSMQVRAILRVSINRGS